MDWKQQAACAGHNDPDLWFDDDPVAQRTALQICYGCPVITPCLNYAANLKLDDGVWGGMPPQARTAWRRRNRRRTA